MSWKTMNELRAETGYAAARFAEHWRTGEQIAGGRVESELIDGVRMWRIVPPGAPTAEPAEVLPPASAGSVRAHSVRLSVSGLGSRTINALRDAGLSTTEELVSWLQPGREAAEQQLQVIDGIGAKSATAILDWLQSLRNSAGDSTDDSATVAVNDVEDDGPSPTEDLAENERPPSFSEPQRAPEVAQQHRQSAELSAELEAWLAANYPSKGTTRGLVTYDEAVQLEVAARLSAAAGGMRFGWDTVHRMRLGEQLALIPRLGARRMIAGDIDRRGQTTFGELAVGVEFPFRARHKLITVRKVDAGESDARPYNAIHTSGPFTDQVCFFTHGCPVDFDLWPDVLRMGDAPDDIDVEMAPCPLCAQHHDDACAAGLNEPTDEFPEAVEPVERNATDGELVSRVIELNPAEVSKEDTIVAPDAPAATSLLDDLWGAPVHVEAPAAHAALDALLGVPVLTTAQPEGTPGGGSAAPKLHPALTDCVVLSVQHAGSAAWHELRAGGIGSSDVGAILGVSPHGTIVDVWRSKTGAPELARPWLELYSEFGSWFEPFLLKHCEIISGIDIVPGAELGTLESVSWEVARANIDGLDVVNGVIEELKTSGESWQAVPDAYFAQVQHQMFVTGCHEARVRQFISPISREHAVSLRDALQIVGCDDILADWLLAAGEVVTWIVERDDAYISRMLDRELAFWSHVESGTEPAIPEPEGVVDLSADLEVLGAVEHYALFASVLADNKPAVKRADEAKKEARRAIERAVSLLENRPKRLVVGAHKATWVSRETHGYWNIYAGEASDVVF